jgi:hypothetical protein
MVDKGKLLAKIDRTARGQWGHVTRWQLIEIGVPPRTITNWIGQRILIAVYPGVYALGHCEQTAAARAAAAVLACGEHAVLSHDSAAALWELRRWPAVPEVTAPTRRRPAGLIAHRSETLTGRDIRRHQGIRVTSPARTICDIQARLTDAQLVRVVNDARVAGILRSAELEHLRATGRGTSPPLPPAT